MGRPRKYPLIQKKKDEPEIQKVLKKRGRKKKVVINPEKEESQKSSSRIEDKEFRDLKKIKADEEEKRKRSDKSEFSSENENFLEAVEIE